MSEESKSKGEELNKNKGRSKIKRKIVFIVLIRWKCFFALEIVVRWWCETAKNKIYSLSLQSIGMLHYIQDVRDHHIFFLKNVQTSTCSGVRILIVCLKVWVSIWIWNGWFTNSHLKDLWIWKYVQELNMK